VKNGANGIGEQSVREALWLQKVDMYRGKEDFLRELDIAHVQ
jgi:hypothetical protein